MVVPVQLELLPTVTQLDMTRESSLQMVKWTVRSTQLSVTSDTKELEGRSSNSSSCESGRPEFKSLALQSLTWLAWAYNHVVGWQVPVRACIKNVQQWASLMHVPRHVDGHAALHTPEREVLAARWCPCFLVVFPFQHWLEPKDVTLGAHFSVLSSPFLLGLMQRLRNRGERDREREREREMRRSSGLRAGSRRDRDRYDGFNVYSVPAS